MRKDVSLFRVGKVWHYRFSIDKKRTQRSTRESAHARAIVVAERAYRAASLQSRCGRVVPTLRELAGLWLAATELTASASHRAGIETFGRLHLGVLAEVRIDQLTTELVESARNEHLQTHAPSSANHWSRKVRLLCRWAMHRGFIVEIPFKVRMLKVQRKPRATLPIDLSRQWLEALDGVASEPVRIAVRLMFGMGLRESEAGSARWEWLDAVRQTYTPGQTKGREADPVPVPGWLMDYLRPLRKPAGLIVSHADGGPFARGFTRVAIKAASARTGIGNITPHRLRGTFATLLSEHGAPVQTIQRVLRHKDVRTTLGYLESDLSHAAHAQARIAEQGGLQ
ncbi:tyrosine-type recombinase/integrase [Paraburkholderia solisilvae]|uniref:Tyrosine recombinase XerC n=1 Tax=Paraburkholderia solisilvae TaxID=624376 RepID=A0A6J5E0B1_9BURK|nr:site-specific integrase [Paraburkholderia solisilvae]CAB3759397.1 Tyrosine recombinase XerC [Paraburkholderia solisilvae]